MQRAVYPPDKALRDGSRDTKRLGWFEVSEYVPFDSKFKKEIRAHQMSDDLKMKFCL